jgi:hypothetical protein
MRGLANLASATALTLAAVSLPVAAGAAVIAQFDPDTNAADYKWVRDAVGTGGEFSSVGTNGPTAGCTTCTATHFSFLDPALSALAFLPATFQIDAVAPDGNPAAVNGVGVWTQTGLDGHFHFTYWNPADAFGSTQTIGGHTLTNGVTNLLSGIFTGAWIQGAGGSGSTNVTIANGGHATFASDLFSVSHVVAGTEEFSLNLLAVSPSFGAPAGKALNSFTANGGGNFSAETVPEPAAWTLMILGFGGIGAILRSRRRPTPASA